MRTESIDRKYMDAWQAGNDNGDGYAVGNDDHTPREAAEAEKLEILEEDAQGCVLARDGYDLVVVCDCNGPWAVDVTDTTKEG